MVDKPYFQLSALQHYAFCKRQAYLIYVEGLWAENYLTASGELIHTKVDSGVSDSRNNIKQVRNIQIVSHKYQMSGLIDLIEYSDMNHITIIEYKRGKPKPNEMDEVQVCAQALCLEEMLGVELSYGYIWYDLNKARHKVCFTDELRDMTISLINEVKILFDNPKAPNPILCSSCKSCSIYDTCLPNIISLDKTKEYIDNLYESSYEEID
ncbi:CRISPR-associated protein Cas4 [Taylorella asinigenitalis]|uniref:CRISPR-associated protein Cas4 n=1 Tax=Taylorella asinigenitalis TaxID=84590 RepID=UPI00048DC32E|nr:CRISPR-associated protein Cas4 [Taylorella asinigenitalis]